ncbi:MAG: DUF2071 domain-containing protein [Deltaproteobacteria bacterium]|nr:MAG: DUF2071 domain-containing protein [Deltaproteobacteria bacterium]
MALQAKGEEPGTEDRPHAAELRPAGEILRRRLVPVPVRPLDIASELLHFALVTYAVPARRLRPHISERFEIPTFEIDGHARALLSVVPFVDQDFHFLRLAPFLRFRFGQTNYRVYVVDRHSGEQVVWFFGTTLGSPLVWPARWLWRIPWHRARYEVACEYDAAARRYRRFCYRVRSRWADAEIEVEDTGAPLESPLPGFRDLEETLLVLTHPVEGYFYRLDGRLGTYSVSHPVMAPTLGRPRRLRFPLLERLAVLRPDEAASPHSILLTPRIPFHIHMPPRRCAD